MPARVGAWLWIGVASIALLVLWSWHHYALGSLLSFENLRASRGALEAQVHAQPLQTAALFFAGYLAVAALSIPGAAVLSLAAGALFGLGWGLVLVSFASSLGGLCAFLVARHLLRATIQTRFAAVLEPVNQAVSRDGSFYLLSLRLLPIFPFWLINLLMGLTPMPAIRFYALSQLGMLPATAVLVNAGTQLARIDGLQAVMSPAVLGSLVLLALFPLLARTALRRIEAQRVYARWKRPRAFERNLVVIGAGAGGLVSAYLAAACKARVTLVEARKMGGDCLNYGCVPSKTLIRSAGLVRQVEQAHAFGLSRQDAVRVDFASVMRRVRAVIHAIEPKDASDRYIALGVEVLHGHARMTSPWEVEVALADGSLRSLTTRSIILATGASPTPADIPGLSEAGYLTSETIWDLHTLPPRLVVLGGGPLGCEMAQGFSRLGSAVTLVELAGRLLIKEDAEASACVTAGLEADGVRVLTGHRALRVEHGNGQRLLVAHAQGREVEVPCDAILVAVGRSPRVHGFGVEELGIALTARGSIATNACLQTNYPNIYAVGDVASPLQYTHAAAHQAWYAVMNALFGRFWLHKVRDAVIPRATFTDPEVAHVGLHASEAAAQGLSFECTHYPCKELDRALVDGKPEGFVKVLTAPGSDRILGVTIVGAHAADMLAEFVLAMRHGLGLQKILSTVHAYPTWTEANRNAAGVWRLAHAPERLRAWLARYLAWERA